MFQCFPHFARVFSSDFRLGWGWSVCSRGRTLRRGTARILCHVLRASPHTYIGRKYSRSKITVKKNYDRTKRFFPPGRGVGFHKCWRRWKADRPLPVTVPGSPPPGFPTSLLGEREETPGNYLKKRSIPTFVTMFSSSSDFSFENRDPGGPRLVRCSCLLLLLLLLVRTLPFFLCCLMKRVRLECVFFSVSVDAEKEIFLFRFVLGFFFALLALKLISLTTIF